MQTGLQPAQTATDNETDARSPRQSLAGLMRHVETVRPDDSAGRALDLLRFCELDTVPVVDDRGVLRGVVSACDFASLVAVGPEALSQPLEQIARPAPLVFPNELSAESGCSLLAGSGQSAACVTDSDGRYLGMVAVVDLLRPPAIPPRPSPVGGMATPWGVYLTNGSLQAGVGNLALMGAGLALGCMAVLAHTGVGIACWGLQKMFGWPLYSLWYGPEPARVQLASAGWYAIHGLTLPLFLLLMRSVGLARYHAAEHMAVHAMERGEPLSLEIVRRMPRVHPRCGTNLMAAGLVFGVVCGGVNAMHAAWLDTTDGAVLGVVAALFTWRSLGAWLQDRFTTRSPLDRHLLDGISAARELEQRYLAAPPTAAKFARRMWCSGMLQTLAGVLISSGAYKMADWLFSRIN